ncbi:MAG: DNA (cytosine-5-)-methyltransferase [Clostridiales bacterium]|nr:DNA (cytosine-5-)-methyltransferase [Clostridiales bacterium]
MKVASMFAGIGGICLGFKQAGFDVVWANEIDGDAVKTYTHNFGDKYIVEGDIRKINVADIPDFDVLTAGFPCQPFSVRGKQMGFKDPRGNLFFEIARVIDKKRPSVIFLENVANLAKHDDGKTFLVIYNTLAQFGYFVKYAVLDAQTHGNIPQKRERIFIVAFLDNAKCKNFEFSEATELTVKLNDIINRSVKHSDCYYYNENSYYFDELKRVVTDTDALYLITDHGVSQKKYYVASTLKANMGTFADRVPVLKDDFGIRKLTPFECLSLQGFPNGFGFSKGISPNAAYKQAGNTVCVPVIRRIAEKIAEAFL